MLAELYDLMDDVTPEEKKAWGQKRKRGQPNAYAKKLFKRRDEKIIEVTLFCTESSRERIRHIYYVCGGLGIVGKDHGKETYWYNTVEEVIGAARWSGVIPWERIVDGTRAFTKHSSWESSTDFLRSVIPQFVTDKWAGQDTRVVICVEKDAITGTLEDLCDLWHVPLLSFHGQCSDGAVHELAKYVASLTGKCKTVKCMYLGDHDSAGCTIPTTVFGDVRYAGDLKHEDDYFGKATRLLWILTDYSEEAPNISYKRLGITAEDVMNPEHEPYLVEANDDNLLEQYVEDMAQHEGFPMINDVPATMGIDVLGSREIVDRTQSAILSEIDKATWIAQVEYRKSERRLLPDVENSEDLLSKDDEEVRLLEVFYED